MKTSRILPWALVVVLSVALVFVLARQNLPQSPAPQQTPPTRTVENEQNPPATVPPSEPPPASPTSPMPVESTPTSAPAATTPAEPLPSPTSAPPAALLSRPLPSPPIPINIIDHTSIALYDQIPERYLREAEKIRMVFFDRSVGWNISGGLDCLASPSWAQSPSHCRRYFSSQVVCNPDPQSNQVKTYTGRDGTIPQPIQFPGGNDRSNIEYAFSQGDYWFDEVKFFVDNFPTYTDRQIVTYGHNYLQVNEDSIIADAFFDPDYDGYNLVDLLALEEQYPDKTFIYWTSSLARTIGTQVSQRFNDQMRAWAKENNRILFDLADILSHTPEGNACINQDGLPVICCEYTTESSGGHLGNVSAGKLQAAKAMWVMLAQIAGWDGKTP